MSVRYKAVSKEALARLLVLDLDELRAEWCRLYKADACPRLSRELVVRAVAHRMQELAFGGLGGELQRHLRKIAQDAKVNGVAKIDRRPALKPGTRLMREWRGRHYELVVLDDGFSWQGVHYRSLSAVARTITGTAWSGPLFFGLKQNRPASRSFSHTPSPAGEPMEPSDVAA